VDRDLAVTYSRGKAAQTMAVASGKIGRLRQARVAAPAAVMEAFTDEERSALAE
jgi:hypothetical protein